VLKGVADAGDADSFVAERELQDAVRALAGRVRGDTKRRAELLQRLERMVATAPAAWLKSGATCAVIANAYGELEQLNEAVKYYDRALVAEPATASLDSVEQLANQLAKLAAKQDKPALDVIGRSARLLQSLTALGKTGERLSLLGATCKRRALTASGRVRLQAITEMIKAYKDGYDVALKNQSANPWYPLSNLVAGKVVMSWQPGARKGAALDVADDMKALRGYGKTVPASSTDFWELCLPADVMLLEAAVQGTLGVKERKALEAAYRTAAERAGTPREVGSATGQIAFLRDMARSSKTKQIQAFAASLDELLQALTQAAGTSDRVRAPSR
jgi:tetratricopeptide (TPR) repeat protein